MDKVMDRVVETQLKIYKTICNRSFVFLTGNLVYKCKFVCQDGSRIPRVKNKVVRKIKWQLQNSHLHLLQNWKKEL